jgi:pimeloyl-ACP methyl ester carboxylesterase
MSDAPTSPEIVLLGGAAEDGDLWADVIEVLDDRVRIHAHAGHVDGSGPPRATIAEMADDVLAALEAPALLVGHSMGGAVALSAALQDPAAVCGVVAVSAGARLPVNPRLLDGLAEDFEAALDLIVAASTGGRRGAAARMEAMLRRGGAALLELDLRACDGFDVRAALGALAPPLLAIVGEEDRMTPVHRSRELADGAGGRLVVIPGAGHQLPWDAPGALAEAIEEQVAVWDVDGPAVA